MNDLMNIITAFLDGQSLVQGLFGFIYSTEHQDDFERGLDYLKLLDENPSPETARAALSYLNKINDDDKLFVQAFACFGRVFCYTAIFDFKMARQQITALTSIETDWITLKRDTIHNLQAQSSDLYAMVNQVEEEYKRQCRKNQSETKFNWKILSIGLIVVIVVLLVLLLV